MKSSFISFLALCSFLVIVPLCFSSCEDDDINNEPEVSESCSDGIQNQNEMGVDCGGVCDPCPVPATYGHMSANVNGLQLNSLPSATSNITGISTLVRTVDNREYLWLQGNGGGYQMNIYIPDSIWGQTGSYDIIWDLFPTTDYVFGNVFRLIPDGFYFVESGTLNISEFDLVTKEFKATFDMQYTVDVDYVETGPFFVTDGTLDYPLDSEEFQ